MAIVIGDLQCDSTHEDEDLRCSLRPYVEDDIAMGRLVAPFSLSVPKGRAWYLVYRPFRETDPGLIAFRGWLRHNFTEKPQS